MDKRLRFVIPAVIITLLSTIVVIAFVVERPQPVEITGLSLVKPGMAPEEVRVAIGHPKRASNTVMRAQIYGVPDEMEQRIGIGTKFEMWRYEESSPSKSVCATVWLVPSSKDAPEDFHVLDVTTQVVLRSVQFRILESIGKVFPGLFAD